MTRDEAHKKVEEIIAKAEKSGEGYFQSMRFTIDRDLTIQPPDKRESFVRAKTESYEKNLKQGDGLTDELPQHIRVYDPFKDFSILCAELDLMKSDASEQELHAVFSHKFLYYKMIKYLNEWDKEPLLEQMGTGHEQDLGKEAVRRIRLRITEMMRGKSRTKGASEIIKACHALKRNDLIVEYLDEDDNILIPRLDKLLNRSFDRDCSRQAYQRGIATVQKNPSLADHYLELIEHISQNPYK